MNLRDRATDAIKRIEKTDCVIISELQTTISNAEGMNDVHVTAFVGTGIMRKQHYTLRWDGKRKEFVEPKSLLSSFKREYRDFKLSKMTRQEIFALLVKANRRRKSTERKAYKLRDKIRRINDDAMTAIGSRQRTIEEQWEVMRELQRRGLVSTEDLEKVLWDVMKIKRPINEHELNELNIWQYDRLHNSDDYRHDIGLHTWRRIRCAVGA